MPFPSEIRSTTLRNREEKTAELADAHARVSAHLLGIFNRVLGEHWSNRDMATLKSPLRAIKLWNILLVVLHSSDGFVRRQEETEPRGSPE